MAERIAANGAVLIPLDNAGLDDAIRQLSAAKVEAIAICYLNAYANPDHERRTADRLRATRPEVHVSVSSDVLPEFREYERGTTASINAAVEPILDRYVRRLQAGLEAQGFRRDLLLMNGNGGTVAARLAPREAAKTIMSGPASGVMAAAATLAHDLDC